MYKISIPENSSSNCFDCVLYSLLKDYNYDYEAYNIKYFYTDYCASSPNSLKYCIRHGWSHENILNDIYNIDLIFTNRNESIDLFEVFYHLINDNPIGIIIDPYYCYWSPFYNITHYSHVILIVDIDYQNKKYICFDVHFNIVGYVEVDFDVININCEKYFVFNFTKRNEIKLMSLLDKINLSLDSFNSNLDIGKSEMFNLIAMNDRKTLFPDNLETSRLLINLMWIAEDKKHFPIALRYIEKKIDKTVFPSIYELLTSSEQCFLLLKSILTKYAITGVLKEDKLKSIINKIFDVDILIVERMKKILKEINRK